MLQLLHEMDYASVVQQDGKRVYTLTPAGQAFLTERGTVLDGIRTRLAAWWQPEARDELKVLMRELGELGRLFPQPWRGPGPRPDQLRRIREVIMAARREADVILAEAPAHTADGETVTAGPGRS
jgi:hypothetical protein